MVMKTMGKINTTFPSEFHSSKMTFKTRYHSSECPEQKLPCVKYERGECWEGFPASEREKEYTHSFLSLGDKTFLSRDQIAAPGLFH